MVGHGQSVLPVSNHVEKSAYEAIASTDSITCDIEEIFAKFLQLEVGDGAASSDTIRNYLSQTKQYLEWCRDNLLSPTEAEPEDIKLY